MMLLTYLCYKTCVRLFLGIWMATGRLWQRKAGYVGLMMVNC